MYYRVMTSELARVSHIMFHLSYRSFVFFYFILSFSQQDGICTTCRSRSNIASQVDLCSSLEKKPLNPIMNYRARPKRAKNDIFCFICSLISPALQWRAEAILFCIGHIVLFCICRLDRLHSFWWTENHFSHSGHI